MEAVKAYYDGRAFVPVSPVKATKNQAAIITILDEIADKNNKKSYLEYAGNLSDESCAEITKALQDTQKVDRLEW
jgi:hypothetical protein